MRKSVWRLTAAGTPEGIRTPDLLVRSQTLYPAELPAHKLNYFQAAGIILSQQPIKVKHFLKNLQTH